MPKPLTRPQEGFTLIEMVISIALAAFVFAALAAVMTASLRTIAVQKGRTRANELATQAIEDLQRYDFNSLGTCPASRAGSPPTGLTDAVTLSSCPGAVNSSFGDPCASAPAATGNALIPKGVYTCFRAGVDPVSYTIRRYIAWVPGSGQTAKRLAVFVDWTDDAGGHQVAQQSSLRAPDQGADIGLGPPSLTNPIVTVISATADNTLDLTADPGQLAGTERVQLSVSSVNNSTPATSDKVFATFRTLDTSNGNAPEQSTLFLTPNGAGTTWSGEIDNSAGHTFGAGTQVITFGIVRNTDGKSNTTLAPTPVRFCPGTGCNATTIPSFLALTPNPVVVDLAPGAGQLSGDVQVSVDTRHVTANDTVTLSFQTRTGAVSVVLDSQGTCSLNGSTTQCTWTGTVPQSAGYTFESTSPQTWYLTASQVVDLGSLEDRGSTSVHAFDVTVTT